MSLTPRPPADGSDIANAGWNSSPAPTGYNPVLLVMEVQRLLRGRGFVIDLTDGMEHVAGLAAGDLLRALGIRPQSAPERH